VLELRGLSKRYGDVQALDGLAFSAAEGELVGFVGPNGAGKTTAMRIVLGLLLADAGEVRWRGRPIDEVARRRTGYMPEERGLYPKMRVGEHLEYVAELHGLDRATAAERTGTWLARLGVEERRGDRVEELSLGNQQRVQLAAALVHEPELLVLDEPFSGLDPVGVEALARVLVEEARGRGVPVVFSSHQLELVERLCDSVAIVNRGRLVASGRVEDLRHDGGGRRYLVDVDAPAGWLARVPGARPLGDGIVELADGADAQALLDAARAAGPVRRFGPDEPTLAELFRDAVSEDA
jgi:ABC-2 type transport system ATP-binding protein